MGTQDREARRALAKLAIARGRLSLAQSRMPVRPDSTAAVLSADRLEAEIAALESQLELDPGEWPEQRRDVIDHRLPFKD